MKKRITLIKKLLPKRKLYSTLIMNYILFSFVTFVLMISILIFGFIQLINYLKTIDPAFNGNQARVLEKGEFENLDIRLIEDLDGWIEIVDENNKVIFTKGNVKEKRERYTEEEIKALTYNDRSEYSIDTSTFRDKNNDEYVYIVKTPKYDEDSDEALENEDEKLEEDMVNFIKRIGLYILVFIILFVINVLFFSFLMMRKIKKPLEKIKTGMKEISEGNEEIYLEHKGEKEFADICSSFNYMVKKLNEAEEEKKKLEESKQKMLADISHDLKTPITTIQGYAEAISQGVISSDQEINKYLNVIYQKSKSITELIDLLFQYVKMNHPDFKLNKENHDISEFMREIIAEYYEEIEDKGFLIDFKIPEESMYCNFDKTQLKRAIANLISNAIKYNDQGITIRIELSGSNHGYKIYVGDNGVGIPDELREAIFNPFVRGDEARSSTGGTGLGLSITKQIIDKHNGTIYLLDDKCKGFKTVFKIWIPK